MFGVSSFAEVPFATLPSLGGALFVLDITENIDVADTNSQAWSFLQSITEPITLEDFNSPA
jgi:hypothetical protein